MGTTNLPWNSRLALLPLSKSCFFSPFGVLERGSLKACFYTIGLWAMQELQRQTKLRPTIDRPGSSRLPWLQ